MTGDGPHVLSTDRYGGFGMFQILASFKDNGVLRLWHTNGPDLVLDNKAQLKLLQLLIDRYPLDSLASV